ncbi:hypothetical protein [Halomicrococcus sp. NG-SE-24]|uniref:hypothetical protein n=1 Tax=Halomicrococcus sp. NG-SE-24 TaxID=3436928 RepID=UPI003D988DAB
MLRTLLGVAKAGARMLLSTSPVRIKSFDRLNVVSLVVQAAYALKKGNPTRALILLGAASVAPRHKGLSYAVQGALTLNDVRKKLL